MVGSLVFWVGGCVGGVFFTLSVLALLCASYSPSASSNDANFSRGMATRDMSTGTAPIRIGNGGDGHVVVRGRSPVADR